MKFLSQSLVAATILAVIGCDSDPPDQAEPTEALTVPAEIQRNRLGDEPSAFLRFASSSPIHWQPWNPEVLEHAQQSNRMIFALVGASRYNGCYETLAALDRNPNLVRRINDETVPVLADIDITREASLIAYQIAMDSGMSVKFPFLMLLSPEGNPVSWHPVHFTNEKETGKFFDNTLSVVNRLWTDDADYVIEDSRQKIAARREKLKGPDKVFTEIGERQQLNEEAVRRLVSSYDEDVTSLAGISGLYPLALFDLLNVAAYDPTLSPKLRQEAYEVLQSFKGSLFKTAMHDVLDGGIHSTRHGLSWNLVIGHRDCSTQARAIRLFARIHRLHDDPDSLEAALRITHFAESNFMTSSELFSLSSKPGSSPVKDWLWTLSDVRSTLDDDEFEVWESYSNLTNIGNLPSEADPDRNYFRLNYIAATKSPIEVAAEVGMSPAQVGELIESGRRKLLKVRNETLAIANPDPSPSALASFRMVSAYAALYTATSDAAWLEKAIKLGKACRQHFQANRFINERADEKADAASDGRAFTYAVAVQAALDLGAVTLEDDWYSWAQDIITLLAEHFVTDDKRLVEVRNPSKVIDIDYEDWMMAFETSTAGLVRLNLARLEALGFRTPPALTPWRVSLPNFTRFPLVFTDTLIAMAHPWSQLRVDVGPEADSQATKNVTTLPLQAFSRRKSPSGGVEVTLRDNTKVSTQNPTELLQFLHDR